MINSGFIGLFITYIILATLILWILTKSDISFWKKLLIIPFTLWWSVALYYTPLGFMGYAVKKDIPDNAIIYSYKVTEPTKNHKGGMYFWIIDYEKIKESLPVDPRQAFIVINQLNLRAHEIPYDKELHKQLVKKNKKKQKIKGLMIWKKVKQKDEEGKEKRYNKKGKFEVINPVKLLPPKE